MLEIADLRLDYPDFHARYDLAVPEGAFCALIGPSGGGKTTLLHALAGFAPPAGGAIRFAGRDITRLPPAGRPLSILFQDHNLLPHLTAGQNVGLGIDPALKLDAAARRRVDAALDRVGLAGLSDRLPAQMSGGQRQRAALARALVRRRPLMLLDEPFGGLDPGLRDGMIALVDELRRAEGLTLVLSIHTPADVAARADLMAFVAAGQIADTGPPAAILAPGRSALIDRYFGRALGGTGSGANPSPALAGEGGLRPWPEVG